MSTPTLYDTLLAVANSELYQKPLALFMPAGTTKYTTILEVAKRKKLVEALEGSLSNYKVTKKGFNYIKRKDLVKNTEKHFKAIDKFIDSL